MSRESIVILHIEDNGDHANLIARCLQRAPAPSEIRLIADGEKALDYLFHRGDYEDPEANPRPDIVLLDLRLPKVDGLEILQQMKATPELESIPVIILTSSDAERDIAEAQRHHANSYLVKPIGFDKFSEMIEVLAFYWLQWNCYTTPSDGP